MPSELQDWNARLSRHFTELHSRRREILGGRPVFALEHGLNPSELEMLTNAVRAYIVTARPSRAHGLAWIVYAAEIGYGYSGDEYWQTFEQSTPGWTTNGDRCWIRDCYRSFQREFGGAVPTGTWAEHFSIICWPITHAILPRDLQRQLARILYELRYSFSAELFESPSTLGEFIAARSWNASSRFQNLAQETQLIGQIAAALLLQGEFGTETLLFPPALKRISDDLEGQRQAREWLRGARRLAQERACVRGLALGRGPAHFACRPDEGRAQVAALGIEPRLVLRPMDSARGSWQAALEIPDLSHLLLKFPKARDVLASSRCVVAGASGPPLARGRCLYGAQRVILTSWPQPDQVLLKFEATDPHLDYLLRTECLLRPGPTWLFRIASDGLAYESRGLRVRPGECYIVVSTSAPIADDKLQPIELGCVGVHGALFHLPPAITTDWESTLQRIGLGQARAIEVWPAGLAAAVWDGEGHGEWLASERPCLAIRTDHPIGALIISMGDASAQSMELTNIVPGEPIFVELPQLPIGLHTVRISTRKAQNSDAQRLGDLDVVMRIRAAQPWSPGISPQGPLLVQIDPAAPTMEQLWEGGVEIALHGPAGRHVKCKVSLFENDASHATLVQQLPRLALPVTADRWTACFDKHFRQSPRAQALYDAARTCELAFTADEFGAFTVRCERDFTPLRWALRRESRDHIVRLIDDSGISAGLSLGRFAFELPFVELTLAPAPQYQVPAAGGMYVARVGTLTAAVIAPPAVCSLAHLRCVPRIDAQERSIDSVLRAIENAALWARAKLPGDLFAKTRCRDVLFAIMHHLFRLVCGDNWARAEDAFRGSNDGLVVLKDAVSRRREEAAVGIVLARDCATLAGATRNDRVERIASLAVKFGLTPAANDAQWLAEFALRLASDPLGAQAWAGDGLRDGLLRLMEQPTLARAARFLVIATDHQLESRTVSRELYAGWEWT